MYKKLDLLYDAVSGVTVALTLMPQSIAYASLAGLDPLVSALEDGCRMIRAISVHFSFFLSGY